jgi:hypothetical protein
MNIIKRKSCKIFALCLMFVWSTVFVVTDVEATVNITNARIQYSCNGTTTLFTYNFKIYEDDDLEVIIADAASSETVLTLNSDYTVAGAGDAAGGTITLTTGSVCPSGSTLTMLKNIDFTQDTDYSDGQTLTADGLETPPDKSRIIDQQLKEDTDRSIKVIKSSTLTDLTIIPVANQAIYFNSAGTGVETRDPGSLALAIPADGSVTGAKISSAEVFDFPVMLSLKKGVDVASASALTLGDDGNSFDITGTTTITSIAAKGVGTIVYLHFDAALTLTHHATDLILPNANDIVTQAGDVAIFKEYVSGDWELVSYLSNKGVSLGMVRDQKGADIASAAALALGDDGNYFDVTGTTAITSIGTKGIGTTVKLHFDAALTLTHHATDLILPGGANITTAAGDEAEFVEYATGDWRCTKYSKASGYPVVDPDANVVIQQVNVQDGAVATGTTVIPFDDTIPQNTEGDEYITLAITPTDANNILKIDVVVHVASSAANNTMTAALFQDSTANAIATSYSTLPNVANNMTSIVFSYRMVAGTTSPTTFKVRIGGSLAGTTTFNGQSGARRMGGVSMSSTTITELTP